MAPIASYTVCKVFTEVDRRYLADIGEQITEWLATNPAIRGRREGGGAVERPGASLRLGGDFREGADVRRWLFGFWVTFGVIALMRWLAP